MNGLRLILIRGYSKQNAENIRLWLDSDHLPPMRRPDLITMVRDWQKHDYLNEKDAEALIGGRT